MEKNENRKYFTSYIFQRFVCSISKENVNTLFALNSCQMQRGLTKELIEEQRISTFNIHSVTIQHQRRSRIIDFSEGNSSSLKSSKLTSKEVFRIEKGRNFRKNLQCSNNFPTPWDIFMNIINSESFFKKEMQK